MSMISTVAGGIGDGGSAVGARLSVPIGLAVVHNATSGSDVLLIADTQHHRIRRVDEAGIITTIAGTGMPGSEGDGGSASRAALFAPAGLAVVHNTTSDGMVLYIADTNNHRIRRVDEGGVISTVVGKGTPGYSGDGGAAVNATLSSPYGVAAVIDTSSSSGGGGGVVLYIADSTNHCIRRVDVAGVITTVAGTGTDGYAGDGAEAADAKLSSPTDVAALFNASSGRVALYIADMGNHCIRHVDEAGRITTVAGNGPPYGDGDGGSALGATLNTPFGLSTVLNTTSGRVVLYIADMSNHCIRRVDEEGIINRVAGVGVVGFGGDGGAATSAALSIPYGVAAVANRSGGHTVLYIVDTGNHRVRRVDEAGRITTVAGNGSSRLGGDGGTAVAAMMNTPLGVAALYNATSGRAALYIADTGNHRIRRVLIELPPSASPSASATASASTSATPSSSVT
ncbi:hypothetical protein EON62_04340, partial [archaeon]